MFKICVIYTLYSSILSTQNSQVLCIHVASVLTGYCRLCCGPSLAPNHLTHSGCSPIEGNMLRILYIGSAMCSCARSSRSTRRACRLQVLLLTFRASLEGLALFGVALAVCILIFSSLVYYMELSEPESTIHSIPDAFWYSIMYAVSVHCRPESAHLNSINLS